MSDSFKCPECGVVRTISEMELWQVYDHDSKETEIDCDNCDSGLLITSLVTGWKFEVEKVQDAIMSGERVMVCRECGSEFISITSFLDHGGTDYATRGELTVNLGTTGTAVSATIAAGDLVQASADAYNICRALSADVVLKANEKLELRCATGNPDTGNGILIVDIAYRVHDFN